MPIANATADIPLYDPRRDGRAYLSLTGEFLGDPQPWRRKLVANATTTHYDFAVRWRL